MRRWQFWITVLAVIGCFGAFDVANWIRPISLVLPTPVLWVLFLAIAVATYVTRQRVRLFYGMWEVYVGLFALMTAVMRAPTVDGVSAEQRNLFFVALMGGIYLIVRGLDNLKQAVPETERWLKRRGWL